MIKNIHLLFEQSGTFKNEFKKLGFNAYDYDILNQFNETDYVIDLYNEIEKSYEGESSLFDKIDKDDIVMAFFPCTRFEAQILLWYRGEALQQKNWTLEKKLETDLSLHSELSKNYELITKLVIVCLRKGLRLIIENPYSEQHYLSRYWCIKPKYIDYDRTKKGDYFKKPTQYWFINIEPQNNLVFEGIDIKKKRTINECFGKDNFQVERSMISPDYAKRFIQELILEN
jgi:hypothetical protein